MKDFTRGSISKHLLFFSLPLVLGDLIQTLSPIAVSIWVGQLLGKEDFAAVSATIPLIFFLFAVAIGIAMGSNILAGQSLGSRNFDFLSKVITNSFLMILSTAVFFSLASFLLSGTLIQLLNTPPEIHNKAKIFFNIVCLGLTLGFVLIWLTSVFRAFGDSKTPLFLYILHLSSAISLCPAYINGWSFFPELGVAGAAWALVSANAIAVLAGFILLFKNKKMKSLINFHIKPHFKVIEKIFALGLPAALQLLLISFGGILVMALVNKFGQDVIVTFGAGLRVDQIAIIPSISMGAAASVLTSQNLGAGHFHRVPEIARWGISISLCFSVLFFLAMIFFPQGIASIFNKNPEVLKMSESYFRIVAASYLFFSIGFVYQGIVRGAGDTFIPLIFAFISTIVLRVPLCYALADSKSLQETGIWIGILITSLFPFILNYFYYHSGKWKSKVIVRTRD